MSVDLLNEDECPEWFSYPPDFLGFIENGSLNIGEWRLLVGYWLRIGFKALRENYPDRDLVPFARRVGSDDVACWEKGKGEEVVVVHNFASPGWEDRGEAYDNFQSWCEAAKREEQAFD